MCRRNPPSMCHKHMTARLSFFSLGLITGSGGSQVNQVSRPNPGLKFALMTAVACMVLAACGGGAPVGSASQASSAAADRNAPVRLGGSTSVSYAPVWLALDKGYFREAGLEVDFEVFGQAGPADKLLAT